MLACVICSDWFRGYNSFGQKLTEPACESGRILVYIRISTSTYSYGRTNRFISKAGISRRPSATSMMLTTLPVTK